jgi:hypothetical protein
MTEAEWLAAMSPMPMLQFLSAGASERKRRLFACACCYRIWSRLVDERSRAAVETCEGYADGQTTDESLRSAHLDSGHAFAEAQWAAESDVETTPAKAAIRLGCGADFSAEWTADWSAATAGVTAREGGHGSHELAPDEVWEQYNPAYLAAETEEAGTQASLLRDIFGNPFRPVAFSPDWRTDTVVSLAKQMYESRDFGAMPILADALQDAGCDSADILDHCRGPGPHVRGCWVVDLVLGKE